ncbi:MAG: hypothetical protein PCFJNLEI_03949 [Verrucomicrobiae bacterium]|nr:hypothetical protein [Verrucomicrobiae bacterium]
MNVLRFVLLGVLGAVGVTAGELDAAKNYKCPYLENPPYGVSAWVQSEMVKSGKGRESRFVPYNSEAAKGLILDASVLRDTYAATTSATGADTAFFMVYDERGWYVYIQSNDPEIQKLQDQGKDISLELFFTPGLKEVPYYQVMIGQLAQTVKWIDWGMPHRHYRSLKNYAKVESLPIQGGVGTFMFIPWEALYDRLPLNEEQWRFTVIRWKPPVTWGGTVHDTGNFGLVQFEKPTRIVAEAIQLRILRAAWLHFQRTARKEVNHWSDEKLGDLEFYNKALKPVSDSETEFGKSLGDPAEWNGATIQKSEGRLHDWMEFEYRVSELRREYLLDKSFANRRE